MEWQGELARIAGSAIVGFFAGRFQTTYNDRVARNKDVQGELLKAIRSCSVSAIDYHTHTVTKDQISSKAFHLKNQLWRVRSDIVLVEKSCSLAKGSLLKLYLDYMDAVTEYPFEPTELNETVNSTRLTRISTAGETLAAALAVARPRLF
jgi:hypothetical protein